MHVASARLRSRALPILLVVLIVSMFVPLTTAVAAPVTIYVDGSYTGGGSDGSAAKPYTSITDGVDSASSGDTVLVAPGTYKASDPDEDFDIEPSVAELTVKSSAGAATTIVDNEYYFDGVFDANMYSGLQSLTIEGFTFKNGNEGDAGGVIWAEGIDLTVRDCVFQNGIAWQGGGAIASFNSVVVVEDCTFADNGWTTEAIPVSVDPDDTFCGYGGAIASGISTLTVTGSTFTGNAAYYAGGAIAAGSSVMTIEESEFTENCTVGELNGQPIQAENGFGGGGGAIAAGQAFGVLTDSVETDFAPMPMSTATIKTSTFTGNESYEGGAIFSDNMTELVASDDVFDSNIAWAGAGVAVGQSIITDAAASVEPAPYELGSALIERSVFEANLGFLGSGVFGEFTEVDVVNSLFFDNEAEISTIFVNGKEASSVMNCTLADNTAPIGVFYPYAVSAAADELPPEFPMLPVTNTIIWDNTRPELEVGTALDGIVPAVVIESGDAWGCDVTYSDTTDDIAGMGNISEDPVFKDQTAEDYRVWVGSPCIDTGTSMGAPDDDLDGDARPQDGNGDGTAAWDMGAYEFFLPYDPGVGRLGGSDRYGTAVDASSKYFEEADTVVIARGDIFADGLASAGLCGVFDAPLLLTPSDALPGFVGDEILRLGAEKAFIMGETGAVSDGVRADLEALGLTVERIGGIDRYETATLIAERIDSELGDEASGIAFVARGDLFPDALSVSPQAYNLMAPILLVKPDAMPSSTVEIIDEYATAVIVGGEGAVGSAVAADIEAAATTERVGGDDRYETAAMISTYAVDMGWATWNITGLSTGEDFPDALCGGPVIGEYEGVMLLSTGDTLSPVTADTLELNVGDIVRVELFGLGGALSMEVQDQVEAIIPTP